MRNQCGSLVTVSSVRPLVPVSSVRPLVSVSACPVCGAQEWQHVNKILSIQKALTSPHVNHEKVAGGGD
uniref:Uncharacterized protein n=1 Tax=Knipowitschia caucasica TaxID=637954 RepID=A0AAV2M4S6_KNICA